MDKKNIFKNKRGIDIVRCCASCRFKIYDIKTRRCNLGNGEVAFDDLCEKYEPAFGIDNAGKGDGKVKKQGYLSYCLKSIFKGQSLDEIRKNYTATHGSIFERM